MSIDKKALIALWQDHLVAKLAVLEEGQVAARAGTRVDGDHRPENRGERAAVTSQGYLALGLGQRIRALEEQLLLLEQMGDGVRAQVVVGALVELAYDDGSCNWIALFPGGDATVLELGGTQVRVVSASAPIAVAIGGLAPGESTEFGRGGVLMGVQVVSVT